MDSKNYKCNKCDQDFPALSPEGECFQCSTGDTEWSPITNKNIQESFKNIAADLGNKTNTTKAGVLKKMGAANKEKAN